jgi:hypothetical protein
MSMPMEKVSLTLNSDTLRQARARVGRRRLSSFVDESLRLRLQHDRIRKLLGDLDERYGPIPAELREEVRREWEATRPQPRKKRRRSS